jgi:hypothetical protein
MNDEDEESSGKFKPFHTTMLCLKAVRHDGNRFLAQYRNCYLWRVTRGPLDIHQDISMEGPYSDAGVKTRLLYSQSASNEVPDLITAADDPNILFNFIMEKFGRYTLYLNKDIYTKTDSMTEWIYLAKSKINNGAISVFAGRQFIKDTVIGYIVPPIEEEKSHGREKRLLMFMGMEYLCDISGALKKSKSVPPNVTVVDNVVIATRRINRDQELIWNSNYNKKNLPSVGRARKRGRPPSKRLKGS